MGVCLEEEMKKVVFNACILLWKQEERFHPQFSKLQNFRISKQSTQNFQLIYWEEAVMQITLIIG